MSDEIRIIPFDKFKKIIASLPNTNLRRLQSDILNTKGTDQREAVVRRILWHDLRKLKSNNSLLGWRHTDNPFKTLDLEESYWLPYPNEFEEMVYLLIGVGHNWFEAGFWAVAERYYLLAIEMCFLTNWAIVALMSSIFLAANYIGASDYHSAYKVSSHALSIARRTKPFFHTERVVSLHLFALYKLHQLERIRAVASGVGINKIATEDLDSIVNIYKSKGMKQEAKLLVEDIKTFQTFLPDQ